MCNLGKLYREQEKLDEANQMYRRGLEGIERIHGKDHPITLVVVSDLANLLLDQGNYVESEKLSRRALEGKERVLGTNHPKTLFSVVNLGAA